MVVLSTERNISDYKANLESYSSDLMKLLNGINQQIALEEAYQQFFTPCDLWALIKYILVGGSCYTTEFTDEIKAAIVNDGILDRICDDLRDLLRDGNIQNCALKEQLKRALKICRCLADTLRTINCNDKCRGLVGKLFCILVKLILLIVAIIAKILILLAFCNNGSMSCQDKLAAAFCNCLICDLSKELDQVEDIIDELSKLAIAFIKCTMKNCRPCNDHKYDNCKCDNKNNNCCNCCNCCDCYEFRPPHDNCRPQYNDYKPPYDDCRPPYNDYRAQYDDCRPPYDNYYPDCQCFEEPPYFDNCQCHGDFKGYDNGGYYRCSSEEDNDDIDE